MLLKNAKLHSNSMRAIISSRHSAAGLGNRLIFFIILAAIALPVLFLYYIDPGQSSLLPPCLFHTITGLHCPGCGALRALHQLVHGHPAAALALNPLAVMAIPFLAYAFIRHGLRAFGLMPQARANAPAYWIWLLPAAIIAFWIARNIPVYPFALLAP